MLGSTTIQEANAIKDRLDKGELNVNELKSFFARLTDGAPQTTTKAERFNQQMEYLNRGTARKIKNRQR